MENQIKHRQLRLLRLADEVSFESQALQRISARRQEVSPEQQQHAQEVESLQALIKEELKRRDELSQWGFSNHVITTVHKVRRMEKEILDAQRKGLKPVMKLDLADLQAEIRRTQAEIQTYIKIRDQYQWRNWDKGDTILKNGPVFMQVRSLLASKNYELQAV